MTVPIASARDNEQMFVLDVFAAAADGQMPPPDGQVEVRPAPSRPGRRIRTGRPWTEPSACSPATPARNEYGK